MKTIKIFRDRHLKYVDVWELFQNCLEPFLEELMLFLLALKWNFYE